MIGKAPKVANARQKWECLCKCGNTVQLRSDHLQDEKREHCGHQCQLLRMKRLRVKVGEVYGRWTVLRDSGVDRTGNATFECKCSCGTIKPQVLAFNLVNGESASCGCLNREMSTVHGLSRDRVHRRKAANKFSRLHPAKKRAVKMKYLHAAEQATPAWLTKEHWAEMDAIYAKARQLTESTGTKMHVDHIVPIQGKTVRGLHVPWNLQILTALENILKSNEIV